MTTNIGDYQVRKVYKAEEQWDNPLADKSVEWWDDNFPTTKEEQLVSPVSVKNVLHFYCLLEIEDCRNLIDSISYYADIIPPKMWLNHTDSKGNAPLVATGSSHRITLPKWAMTPATICHEMAHVITQQKCMFDAHGPIFCGVFVELVYQFIGSQEGRDLQWAFEVNSVDVEYNII